MVAEVVQETEVVPAPGSVPETPESLSEPTAPEVVETPEVDEDLNAALTEAGYEAGPAKEETKASPTPADSPDASLEGLTPQQILQRGKQLRDQELQQHFETTNASARETGMRQSLITIKNDVKSELVAAGLDTERVLAVLQKMDEHHGTVLAVNKLDVEKARAQLRAEVAPSLQEGFAQALLEAAVKFTGSKSFKAESVDDYVGKIAAHAAKTAAAEAYTKGWKAMEKVYADNGIDRPGKRYPTLPNNRGGGNSRVGTTDWAKTASISELEAHRARERSQG